MYKTIRSTEITTSLWHSVWVEGNSNHSTSRHETKRQFTTRYVKENVYICKVAIRKLLWFFCNNILELVISLLQQRRDYTSYYIHVVQMTSYMYMNNNEILIKFFSEVFKMRKFKEKSHLQRWVINSESHVAFNGIFSIFIVDWYKNVQVKAWHNAVTVTECYRYCQ